MSADDFEHPPAPQHSIFSQRHPDDSPEWCPRCREWKPLSEWLGTELTYDPEASIVCKPCRDGQRPPPLDPGPELCAQDRQLLVAWLECGDAKEACKKTGLHPDALRDALRGHSRAPLRRAFQKLLESEGLDMPAIARKAKMLFHSQRAQWNKATESWDFFPDNSAQLGTLRHLTKLHEMEPPKEDAAKSGPVVPVQIVTNVFSDERREKPGTFEVRAEVSSTPPSEDDAA